MAVVTTEKLSKDIKASARALVEGTGFVPQSRDQPLSANDLLFYLNDTSMPMAGFLQENGLFVDGEGLHFDPVRFATIRAIAETVIRDYQAGNRDGVWTRFDLSEDEDVEGNGTYLLVVPCLTVFTAPPRDVRHRTDFAPVSWPPCTISALRWGKKAPNMPATVVTTVIA